MSASPAEIIRRWFKEVWSESRAATIDELLHPKAVLHGLTDEEGIALTGPAGFKVFYRRFTSSFTDIQIVVEDAFSEGNKGAGRFVFTATHSGDGLGIPATGRKVRVTGMAIAYIEDGQVKDSWNEFDTATLLHQLQQPLEVKVMA